MRTPKVDRVSCSELCKVQPINFLILVSVEKNCGDVPARSFTDYQVKVGSAPAGVMMGES